MDESLFGDEEPQPDASTDPAPGSIAQWQVAQIRGALDARGVTSMAERQHLIEEIAGRAAASLRDLTSSEGRRLVDVLASKKRPTATVSRSAWDDRDEDTWIDKL